MQTSELYFIKIKIRCRIIMHVKQVNDTCKLMIIDKLSELEMSRVSRCLDKKNPINLSNLNTVQIIQIIDFKLFIKALKSLLATNI